MENISIRKYITDSFKGDNESEIKQAIDDTIKEGLEEALPGLGVFMEIIWNNASDELKKELLEILKAHLN
ncbi:MAG TPA: small acid-soluble spore protein SspI [Candidatus Aphodocola excrementigallinarum]|uniref:Small, acid-soluble spore protein I n=1 Tax=Candidatus Aphodocola excrementigallinarum TaxID=2840670 RepID=A0A9D1LGE2_9FIRM|nr:small acid-soluble spore protein SspI [Candidatus Aphodocola excrementigallinarum]